MSGVESVTGPAVQVPWADDPAAGWAGDRVDLAAYLRRVGVSGPLPPTVDTLRRLQYAHITSIPFENLEIVLGRGIPLEVERIEDKLVRAQRGGYCFEHATLFAAVLDRLGFGVSGLSARVGMRSGRLRPATHAVVRASTSDSEHGWICDVGFGSGPFAPIAMVEGATVAEGGWEHRLHRYDGGRWGLDKWSPDGWLDMHDFSVDEQYGIDYEVGNYHVSTNPRSPFVGRLIAQRIGPGFYHVLDGRTLTTTYPDGREDRREFSAEEVPDVLADTLGIVLDAGDRASVVTYLTA